MRKWIKTSLYESALFAGTGFMDWLIQDFPGWVWGLVCVVSVAVALAMHWQDARRAVVARLTKPPSEPSIPEPLRKELAAARRREAEAKAQSDLADAKFKTALYRFNALLGSAFAAPEDRDRKDEDQS